MMETQWHAPEEWLTDEEAVQVYMKVLTYEEAQGQNPGLWVA